MPMIDLELELPADLLELLRLEATERGISLEKVIAEIFLEYLGDINPGKD